MAREDILDNIIQWRALLHLKGYGQYAKLKFNQGADRMVRKYLVNNGTFRVALFTKDEVANKKNAFVFATHLINAGIQPEAVMIVTMDQCLEAMWARPEAEFNKQSIFDKRTQLLMVIDCYKPDEKMNNLNANLKATQFKDAFKNYCRSNPHINIILASSDGELTPENCLFSFDIDENKKHAFHIVQGENKR